METTVDYCPECESKFLASKEGCPYCPGRAVSKEPEEPVEEEE